MVKLKRNSSRKQSRTSRKQSTSSKSPRQILHGIPFNGIAKQQGNSLILTVIVPMPEGFNSTQPVKGQHSAKQHSSRGFASRHVRTHSKNRAPHKTSRRHFLRSRHGSIRVPSRNLISRRKTRRHLQSRHVNSARIRSKNLDSHRTSRQKFLRSRKDPSVRSRPTSPNSHRIISERANLENQSGFSAASFKFVPRTAQKANLNTKSKSHSSRQHFIRSRRRKNNSTLPPLCAQPMNHAMGPLNSRSSIETALGRSSCQSDGRLPCNNNQSSNRGASERPSKEIELVGWSVVKKQGTGFCNLCKMATPESGFCDWCKPN